MPKVDRSGQATVLSPEQLEELFAELPQPHRVICQIAYFTAARIGEVCSLRAADIAAGRVTFRAAQTKTKRTRTVKISKPLAEAIEQAELPKKGYLFPSRSADGHISTQAVDEMLRRKCDYLGLHGVSTHSFRRSVLTHLHKQGHPLKALSKISGHTTLSSLERYLDLDQNDADAVLDSAFG